MVRPTGQQEIFEINTLRGLTIVKPPFENNGQICQLSNGFYVGSHA